MAHRKNETRREALEFVRPHLAELERRVLGLIEANIEEHGGATSWEISQELGILYPTASSTVRDLQDKGLLRDSGHRRIATKKEAIVWELGRGEPRVPLSKRQAKTIEVLQGELAEVKDRMQGLEDDVEHLEGQTLRCPECKAEFQIVISSEP